MIMDLKGYYSEETLIELFQQERITRLQFICLHSPEKRDDFISFCRENGLKEDEEAAERYTDAQVTLEREGDI